MIALTTNFSEEVEKICKRNGLDYIDAVVTWCERNKIEVEYVAALIKKDAALKAKIQSEAENLNILKRSASLPL
jgi:hypothetical protein